MTLVPIIAIVLFVLLFSKEEAQASEPPQAQPSDQELVAELLTKLLERNSQK